MAGVGAFGVRDYVAWIEQLTRSGDTTPFYLCRAWRRVRRETLASDKYECQRCKQRGIYTRATMVHHINPIKLRPDLALQRSYKDVEGRMKRNLISLCNDCHEMEHPERYRPKRGPLTEERW